ncbi:hypothetical protein EAH_00047500 [Eimeria acervulina]|uniref:Uncharacterized protein n=1 Tax=Eimeria acervulina TaxID=5801 RepID=U6GZV8_EIMAC|nr:hypothetical protein EAH_00047500 [Eimeria acervulina]CDI84024.1 hypothetical protein EAH_00047500 [Eimeria acervulina]
MLEEGCIAFSVYCLTAGADKCKMRRNTGFNTALDLASVALFNEWRVLSVAFEKAMGWCACVLGVAGYYVLVHAGVYSVQRILPHTAGCVAFGLYCHAGSADKCKMRLSCVLNSALDLAAAALRMAWGARAFSVACEDAMRWCPCALMVAGYSAAMRIERGWGYPGVRLRKRCAGVGGADKCIIRLSCVLNSALDLAAAAFCIDWGLGVFSGAFEGAMGWCACTGMTAGDCLPVHGQEGQLMLVEGQGLCMWSDVSICVSRYLVVRLRKRCAGADAR